MTEFLIPLYRRNGEIAGHARVDADDYARLSGYTWRVNAGTGYAVRFENGPHWMHREVLGVVLFDGAESDHVNLNRLDNRKLNLRWATHGQNMQNRPIHKNNTSGARGVLFDKRAQCWYGQVKHAGRRVWLRYFDNKQDAIAATTAARRELLPFATA